MKVLGRAVLAVVTLYVVFLGALTLVIPDLELFGKVMARVPRPLWGAIPMKTLFNILRAGKLKPGDPAPDFNLPSRNRREHVQLSSFRGKQPVVLIFGSYT